MVQNRQSSEFCFCYDQDSPHNLVMLGNKDRVLQLLLMNQKQFMFIWLDSNNNRHLEKQFRSIQNSLSIQILKYTDLQLLITHINEKRVSQNILIICSPQLRSQVISANKFQCIICFPAEEYICFQNCSYTLYNLQSLEYVQSIIKKYQQKNKMDYKWLPNFLNLDKEVGASNTLVRILWAMINCQKNLISQALVTKELQALIQNLSQFHFSLQVDSKLLSMFIQDLNQAQMPAERSIYWYTMQSQIFKIINNLLRSTQQPSLIFYIQPYFTSLFKAVSALYKQQKKQRQFICYRGGKITKSEIDKFYDNIGGLAQNLSFLSTSLDPQISENYMKNVTFQITVNEQNSSFLNLGYACLSEYSQYYQESEVLFNPLNFFKVLSIKEQIRQGQNLFTIQLLLVSQKKDQPTNMNENQKLNVQFFSRQKKLKDSIICQGHALVTEDQSKDGGLFYWQKMNQIIKKKLQKVEADNLHNIDDERLKNKEHQIGPLKKAQFQSLRFIGICFQNKGEYQRARKFYNECQQQMKEFQRVNIFESSDILSRIAKTYFKQDRFKESLRFYSKSQQILVQNFAENSQQLANLLEKQARVYQQLNQFDTAYDLYDRSIKIKQKLSSQFILLNQLVLEGVARILQEKQQFGRALRLYWKVFKIRSKLNGFNDPDLAKILSKIAQVYQIKGQFKKALQYNSKSLSMQQRYLPHHHPDIAYSLYSLAISNYQQSQFQGAFQNCLKAQQILIKSDQQKNSLYMNILHLLANIYSQKNQNAQALKMLKMSKQIAFEVYGINHSNSVRILFNMSNIYLQTNKLGLAIQILQQAENAFVNSSEKPKILYSCILNNMGIIQRIRSNVSRALELFQASLEYKRLIYKSGHQNLSISLNNIANLYLQMLNFSKALQTYQQSKQIVSKFLGSSHPSFGNQIYFISSVYFMIGDLETTLRLQRHATNIKCRFFGNNHVQHLLCLMREAFSNKIIGTFRKSQKILKHILPHLFQKDKSCWIQCYKNLAQLYLQTGNRKQNQKFFDQHIFLNISTADQYNKCLKNRLSSQLMVKLPKTRIFIDF